MTRRFRALLPATLTHEECAEAIASAEARGFEPMAAQYPNDYRNNARGLVDDAALSAKLFERLRPHLPPVWTEGESRWHLEAVTAGTKYVMRTNVMYRRMSTGRSASPAKVGALRREKVFSGNTGYVWVVRALADGRLVSGSRDCTVRSWGTGEIVREGLAGSATAIVEVGGLLWVGGRNGTIDDGRRRWQTHDGVVLGLERMPNGEVVSCGADGIVRRWSSDGESIGEVVRHSGWVWGLAIAGEVVHAAVDPISAIAIGATGDRSGTVKLAKGPDWQAHAGAVTALARVGSDLWVNGGAVRVWSQCGELLGEGAHQDFVRGVAVLDSHRFATASYDGTVAVWTSPCGGAIQSS